VASYCCTVVLFVNWCPYYAVHSSGCKVDGWYLLPQQIADNIYCWPLIWCRSENQLSGLLLSAQCVLFSCSQTLSLNAACGKLRTLNFADNSSVTLLLRSVCVSQHWSIAIDISCMHSVAIYVVNLNPDGSWDAVWMGRASFWIEVWEATNWAMSETES